MKSKRKRRMSADLLDCRNKVKWSTGKEGYIITRHSDVSCPALFDAL